MAVFYFSFALFSCLDWEEEFEPLNLNSKLVVFAPRSTQIKTYSWDNAQVLLVGNKCDMEDERVVSADRGRQLSEHLGKFKLLAPFVLFQF